jgi:xanthine dehydrogenase small subunit
LCNSANFKEIRKQTLIRFILNDKEIETSVSPALVLLDFVRYHKNLMGTKIGCREGDCGACTVLLGQLKDDKVVYRSFTSCLTPLANVRSKHVVTIEGINIGGLNPIQQAMCDNSATQCGFCTPGFVVSMAGFCLSEKELTQQNAVAAIDGNICRCTGYKSIERAAASLVDTMNQRQSEDALQFVLQHKILPPYFADIKERLLTMLPEKSERDKSATSPLLCTPDNADYCVVGGGTDLYVQKHDEMRLGTIRPVFDNRELHGITKEGNKCIIGPSATVTDLLESAIFIECFPGFVKQVKLISSTPIRNMATIAGNFVNASPIGDLTIFFLALNTTLVLSNGTQRRHLPLRKFYQGYKTLDKRPEEHVESVIFEIPKANTRFNFEKVSKRTHLDIASVNSALAISINRDVIIDAGITAGGVAAVPLLLEKTSSYISGKILSEELIRHAIEIAQTEISPISDARGTEKYKRLLLSQLIKTHFLTLFPRLEVEKVLYE